MICIDANLIIRKVLDPKNEVANRLWDAWDQAHTKFMAPALIHYEITNGFHRLQVRKILSVEAVELCLKAALAIPVEIVHDPVLSQEALDIAHRFRLAAAYDSHYLALALRHNLEFWTADERLWNSLEPRRPDWVKFLPYSD